MLALFGGACLFFCRKIWSDQIAGAVVSAARRQEKIETSVSLRKEFGMTIRRYTKEDEEPLFDLLREEGDDWSDYHGEKGRARYKKALETGVTYVACEDGILCGYARCREDDGFGVYVYDLLVRKSCRGKQLGRILMEQVCTDFPGQTIYVMSDADPYYEKLGYRRVGSIFEVRKQAD